MRRAALIVLVLLTAALAASAAPAARADGAAESGPAALALDPRLDAERREAVLARGEAIGRGLIAAKLGAAVVALALVVWGHRLARRGRADHLRRARAAALLVVALFAFAASYNFFVWRHYNGVHAHEFFHYYLGARYFPELGYYDLYDCAAAAATEGRPAEANRPHDIRDLRRIEHRRIVIPARSVADCRARFGAERWAAFRSDTRFLRGRLPPQEWARVLTDQGLNASPVWLLFGRTLGEWVPPEPQALRLYARLDLVVLVAAFLAVGWAFGLEGFCLAVIAWSANPLARYEWVGDAPLRQLWFGASLAGLALLRRRRYAGASIFLALGSLLRVFPLFFAIGYALRALRRWLAERTLSPDFVRFAVVGTAAGLLLLALSVPIAGRGVGVFGEFAENMSSYASLKARNSMGLRALLTHTPTQPAPRLIDGRLVVLEEDRMAQKRRTFASRRPFYWIGAAIALVLLWRALERCEDWEAAALGFVLVLVFTQAASYYMTCTVAAALLGTRRRLIAIGMMAALVAWGVIALAMHETADGFAVSSVVVLALAVWTMWAMRSPPDADAAVPT